MPPSNLPNLKKLQMILSLSPVCICIVVQSGLASQPLLFCNRRWQSTAPLNRAIPETLDPELRTPIGLVTLKISSVLMGSTQLS